MVAVARRTRSRALSGLALAAVVCLAAHWSLSAAFLQPRQQGSGAAPAALGALTALGSALPAWAGKGPLAGTEVCLPTSKPLVWVIYPLCDPIYLISPVYLFPILLVIFGGGITVLNLLIP